MSNSRSEILAAIRHGNRDQTTDEKSRKAAVRNWRDIRHSDPTIGEKIYLAEAARQSPEEIFTKQAEAVQTTICGLEKPEDIPAEVSRYLAQHNLPAQLRLSPHPDLAGLDWAALPSLSLRTGLPSVLDTSVLTAAEGAIAETGSLIVASGPDRPYLDHFLSASCLVILSRKSIYPTLEDFLRAQQQEPSSAKEVRGWTGLAGNQEWPRMMTLVTGPSRTGDVGQVLELGAHGPLRLHILLTP